MARQTVYPGGEYGSVVTLEMPDGFFIAGNYGDGFWRVCHENNPQRYIGDRQLTVFSAQEEAFRLSQHPYIDILVKKRA